MGNLCSRIGKLATVTLLGAGLAACGNSVTEQTVYQTMDVREIAPGERCPAGGIEVEGADGPFVVCAGQDGHAATAVSEPPGDNCAAGGTRIDYLGEVWYLCDGTDGADGSDGTDGNDGSDASNLLVEELPVGNANCPNGGIAVTDSDGNTTYVCNGLPGDAEPDPVLRTVSAEDLERTPADIEGPEDYYGFAVTVGADSEVRIDAAGPPTTATLPGLTTAALETSAPGGYKIQIQNYDFVGTRLRHVTGMSWYTFQADANATNAGPHYVQVYFDVAGGGSGLGSIVYDPAWFAETGYNTRGEWVHWDAFSPTAQWRCRVWSTPVIIDGDGTACSNNQAVTFEQIATWNPDAVIALIDIQAGQNSGGGAWENWQAWLDGFTVEILGTPIVYDFD